MKSIAPALATLALFAAAPAYASCGSSFCSVNSNWTAETATAEGASVFDLRYEHVRQDQPWHIDRKVAVGEIRAHHDEIGTSNHNLVASYSRQLSARFGLTLSAALAKREHDHIHNHHGAKLYDAWDYTRLGDLKVVGRYQLMQVSDPLKPSNAGVTFGVKLPTGGSAIRNAEGDLAERSMQPGTGTTDAIVGGYYFQRLTASDATWFVQGQYQRALGGHAGFRPGDQLGLDLGMRKGLGGDFGLLAQLNFVRKQSDSGSEAEPASSGGRQLSLSPGLSYAVNGNLQLYAFYQHPLQRRFKGVQLTANRAFVLGLTGQL